MPGMHGMQGGGAADALRIGRAAAALKMDKAKQAAARKWEEVKEKVGGVRDKLAGGGGMAGALAGNGIIGTVLRVVVVPVIRFVPESILTIGLVAWCLVIAYTALILRESSGVVPASTAEGAFTVSYAAATVVVSVIVAGLYQWMIGKIPRGAILSLLLSSGGVWASVVFDRILRVADSKQTLDRESQPGAKVRKLLFLNGVMGIVVAMLAQLIPLACPFQYNEEVTTAAKAHADRGDGSGSGSGSGGKAGGDEHDGAGSDSDDDGPPPKVPDDQAQALREMNDAAWGKVSFAKFEKGDLLTPNIRTIVVTGFGDDAEPARTALAPMGGDLVVLQPAASHAEGLGAFVAGGRKTDKRVDEKVVDQVVDEARKWIAADPESNRVNIVGLSLGGAAVALAHARLCDAAAAADWPKQPAKTPEEAAKDEESEYQSSGECRIRVSTFGSTYIPKLKPGSPIEISHYLSADDAPARSCNGADPDGGSGSDSDSDSDSDSSSDSDDGITWVLPDLEKNVDEATPGWVLGTRGEWEVHHSYQPLPRFASTCSNVLFSCGTAAGPAKAAAEGADQAAEGDKAAEGADQAKTGVAHS